VIQKRQDVGRRQELACCEQRQAEGVVQRIGPGRRQFSPISPDRQNHTRRREDHKPLRRHRSNCMRRASLAVRGLGV